MKMSSDANSIKAGFLKMLRSDEADEEEKMKAGQKDVQREG